MEQTRNFWVLGGDLRQEKLAMLLRRDGHSVHTYALSAATGTDLTDLRYAQCVVLPLPVSVQEGMLNAPAGGPCPLQDIFAQLCPGQFLCGGMVGEDVRALAAQYGLTVHDYFQREELAVANAVPVALAVWHREKTAIPQGFGGSLCVCVSIPPKRGEVNTCFVKISPKSPVYRTDSLLR